MFDSHKYAAMNADILCPPVSVTYCTGLDCVAEVSDNYVMSQPFSEKGALPWLCPEELKYEAKIKKQKLLFKY